MSSADQSIADSHRSLEHSIFQLVVIDPLEAQLFAIAFDFEEPMSVPQVRHHVRTLGFCGKLHISRLPELQQGGLNFLLSLGTANPERVGSLSSTPLLRLHVEKFLSGEA